MEVFMQSTTITHIEDEMSIYEFLMHFVSADTPVRIYDNNTDVFFAPCSDLRRHDETIFHSTNFSVTPFGDELHIISR